MSEDLDENISSLFQRWLPFGVSVLFVIIFYMPLGFLSLNGIRPMVGIACVYFWLQHRPDVFNLWSVFGVGVVADILSSSPMGANILEMLLMYSFVNVTSRFFNAKPFVVLWYGFMLLTLAVLFINWLLLSVYYSQFLPLSMLLFAYLITIAIYPLLSLLLAFVQNKLMKE